MREKVVIIIPTYNEGLVISETIHLIFALTHGYDIHILIFDSASTDNTRILVQDLQVKFPQLYLLTEPQKTGLGSAYHQAMQHAIHVLDADVIVEFDADLSHQPKYLAPMLRALQNHHVVVGSRYISGGSLPDNWGWKRRLLSKLGNFYIKKILKLPYHDLTSGFRMTRREALMKVLPPQFISNQFAYKIELYWRLYKYGYQISEYPIEFVDRTKGQSKLPKGSIQDSLNVVFRLAQQQS